MNGRTRTIMLAAMLICCAVSVYAQVDPPVDFDTALDRYDEQIGGLLVDEFGDNQWLDGSPPVYEEVPQDTPEFVGVDNDANGIQDDDHFALLEALLNGTGCVAPSIPAAAVRVAYEANRATIKATELTVPGVRVTFSYSIWYYNRTITMTTGTRNCLPSLPFVGTTCFDVPSLYEASKPGGSFLEGDDYPHFLQDSIDLGAGFMTLGDQYGINYWQDLQAAIMKRVIVAMLPQWVAGVSESAAPSKALGDGMLRDVPEDFATQATSGAMTKGAATHWSCDGLEDLDETVRASIPRLGTVNMRIRVSSANLCTALTNYLNSLRCANYSCQGALLSAQDPAGDLNGNGVTNLDTYAAVLGDRDQFLIREWAAYADLIDLDLQPVGNIPPDPEVTIPYGGPPWWLSVGVDSEDLAARCKRVRTVVPA